MKHLFAPVRPRKRVLRLVVEELEDRRLLSGSGLLLGSPPLVVRAPAAPPPPAAAPVAPTLALATTPLAAVTTPAAVTSPVTSALSAVALPTLLTATSDNVTLGVAGTQVQADILPPAGISSPATGGGVAISTEVTPPTILTTAAASPALTLGPTSDGPTQVSVLLPLTTAPAVTVNGDTDAAILNEVTQSLAQAPVPMSATPVSASAGSLAGLPAAAAELPALAESAGIVGRLAGAAMPVGIQPTSLAQTTASNAIDTAVLLDAAAGERTLAPETSTPTLAGTVAQAPQLIVPLNLLQATSPQSGGGGLDALLQPAIPPAAHTVTAAPGLLSASPTSGTDEDGDATAVAPVDASDPAVPVAAVGPAAVGPAIQQLLREVDGLGNELASWLSARGLSAWMMAAAVTALALEVARRRWQRRSGLATVSAGADPSSSWFPGTTSEDA